MADYFVASGGSNTAPYDTWAKAATSLATALAAATADNDRVIIQYNAVPSGDAELSADTTYTFAGNVALIAASNDGGSVWTPNAMGSANWIGNSTTNRGIVLAGAFRVYLNGITLRISGSTSDDFSIGATDGSHYEFEDCRIWQGNTSSAADIFLGADGQLNSYLKFKGCEFVLGSTTSTGIRARATQLEMERCTFSGSIPSVLFQSGDRGGRQRFSGCDFSSVTGSLFNNSVGQSIVYILENCKLGSGMSFFPSTPSPANKGSAQVWVFDCSSGDEHYHIQYHDAFGSLTTDTGIYANDGAQYDGTNFCSWKIVTTANCSYFTPFVTPWFDAYHSGTSAVTPSIEILRDGSTTAYQDDEVWGEWAYKGTTGSTISTMVDDRKALAAAAANQAAGVGTSGWTGENASAWSGKLAPGSTITPAEIGHIRGRVCVGEPSITVYVDPQTRLA